ncbi:hypothetical protein ACFSO7_17080 [Bacillus sp. CGMCC 1.16607]|uniref:hypothetical protein n=1 Tax=Bacillus sp. CGMCC 1.16607 TaxID=3351842 RepID=UPI00362AD8A9
MDIQKTYLKQAHLFINSSIIVLIPAIILIVFILTSLNKSIILLIIPFLIYSIYLFQSFLLSYKRYLKVGKRLEKMTFKKNDFISDLRFFLYKDQEAKELLLFHASGVVLAKFMKKKMKPFSNQFFPSEIILVDESEKVLASYFIKDGVIDVYQSENGYIGSFSSENGELLGLSGIIIGVLKKKMIFTDDRIINENGRSIFRIQKGWMPLESQKLFLNPNTPMLTLSSNLPENEKLLCFSAIVKRYF